MVYLSFALVSGLAALSANAAPIEKRIQQTISASTAKWEQACIAAGGAQQCNPVSVNAFTTLLAAAGDCDQQNAADSMIDLAKTLNNDPLMIQLAQIFAQQPRNTPTSESVPYCQQAPKNSELNGLFQCQFAGANPDIFVGGVSVGQPGTIPLGHSTPQSPSGSCPANTVGPVADGTQLVDITQNPGSGTTTGTPATQQPAAAASPSSADNASANQINGASSSQSSASAGFKLQNGKDAQQLNAKFATLTDGSACTSGENACIQGKFAQCANNKFVTTQCAATLTCAALPLVNSPGTSVTCTTTADAEARIAASGALGGLTGSGAASSASPAKSLVDTKPAAQPSSSTPSSSNSGFKLQNGKDAQALNAKFATLSTSSSCNAGEIACIDNAFAQCANGVFVVTQCAQPLICAALPLVNSPGTSVACTTEADALARIQATGTKGGISG